MRRPGRPSKPKSEVKELIAVRLDPDQVQAVDGYVKMLKTVLPLLEITRADAIRHLLDAGIKAELKKGKTF